ncbi:MAG: hypothetical protein ACO3CR_05620, partial [Solirubrobacterales bacterium]
MTEQQPETQEEALERLRTKHRKFVERGKRRTRALALSAIAVALVIALVVVLSRAGGGDGDGPATVGRTAPMTKGDAPKIQGAKASANTPYPDRKGWRPWKGPVPILMY